MERKILFAMLVLALAALAGCDPGGTASSPVAGQANALTGEETGGDTEAAEAGDPIVPDLESAIADAVAELDESTPGDLVVAWTDSADSGPVSKLAFTVTNTSDGKIAFEASVVADGVVGKAEKKVGERTLATGESVEFEVDASALPVRSAAAVNQIGVKLARTIDTPEGPREISVRRGPRMFRHLPGYASVRTYTRAALIEELDGVLFSVPAAEATDLASHDDIVGEIAAAKGYKSVKRSESGIAAYDGDGDLVSVTTRVRVADGLSFEEEQAMATSVAPEEDVEEVDYE